MTFTRVPLAVALCLLCGEAEAAQGWTVEIAALTTLAYGEPGKPALTIGCIQESAAEGKGETRIAVEAAPGTKPGKGSATLVVSHKGGAAKLPLEPVICTAEAPCPGQPEGDVARYEMRLPTKQLALDIAEKGKRLSFDAPGAKLDLAADEQAFEAFAGACRNW
jgi:hypothetical protein